MKYIKKFSGYFCAGEVVKIIPSGNSVLKFNDNACKQYSRDQLKNIKDC